MADIKCKYIEVPFEVKNIDTTSDSKYHFVEGYASVFNNTDRAGEVVMPGAFDNTLVQNPKVKFIWQHQPEMPLGIFDALSPDSKGLYVKARMPKADSFVSDRVIPQMEIGSIDSMSIGYVEKDVEYKGARKLIHEVDLYEISLVTMPANVEAVITEFKAFIQKKDIEICGLETPWDPKEASSRVKQALNSKSTDFDELSFIDVVDGKIKVVPKGVIAVTKHLEEKSDELNLSKEDKEEMIDILSIYSSKIKEKYAETIGSPSFEKPKFKNVRDIACMRDVEDILNYRADMSQAERRVFISEIKSMSRKLNEEDLAKKQMEVFLLEIESLKEKLKN